MTGSITFYIGNLKKFNLSFIKRNWFVSNVVGHLKKGVSKPVLQRAFEYWCKIDKDIGERIKKGGNS
ncbi:MAG: hypothetical protein JSR93_01260 [Verrucomicrobia bacterium]|nr:hypothetical protein [Verrucomicrobiota bacterium]